MTVPDFQTAMLPLMQALVDRERSTADLVEALANRFQLSDADRQALLPSGRQRLFTNRVGWAATHLRKAGLIESPTFGRNRLSQAGRDLLGRNPSRVDMRVLDSYPAYRAWRTAIPRTSEAPATPSVPSSEATPEEVLEATHHQLDAMLQQGLLERLHQVSPSFFERIVVDLVVAMGYGGSREEAGRAVGQTGDEGIDGIINEDRLGLDVIYLQAKRWTASVGRPQVQMFAGSLEGKRASKGIFITTSTFTPEAREYVRNIGKTIVLIDGPTMGRLMVEHGVGVTDVATYIVRRVDTDYFDIA